MATGSSITNASLPASFSVPSAHETNMNDRKLSCLVDGDSVPFMVAAPPNIRILELVSLVYNQKDKGVLDDVNASDMILWKVISSQKLAWTAADAFKVQGAGAHQTYQRTS
jgi:hypothetical protein